MDRALRLYADRWRFKHPHTGDFIAAFDDATRRDWRWFFDRTFFSNLFTYFGIPVLGVILTQFPAVGSLLGAWLQPLLRLLSAS